MDGYYWESGRQDGQGARRGPPREQEGEEEQHFDDLMSREPILFIRSKRPCSDRNALHAVPYRSPLL